MANETNNPLDPAVTPEVMAGWPQEQRLALAVDLGLLPEENIEPADLIVDICRRRDLLSELDRDPLTELVAWGHRRVKTSAGKAELAREIARIRRMRFHGLSREALYTLARLREANAEPDDDPETLIRALKEREGVLAKLGRKRRSLLGKLVGKLMGDQMDPANHTLPPTVRTPTLKERIEERGLVGGLADKLRGAADDFIAIKLDEIEERIDQKLDDIDSRLAEWRDREIANRLRIIKITLAASIIVALISVAYAWVKKTYLGS